jgi:hypothetical protein
MNAVAKGAAMKGAGIGASMPQPIQRLRRAYGFVATGYDIDSKGKKVETTGQIDWVLKSGDIIPPVGRAEFKRAVEATCSTTSVRTKKIDITFVTSTRSDSGHLLPSTTKELGNRKLA